MRRHYETPEQRAEETRIAEIVAGLWNYEVVHLPDAYNLDWVCHRNNNIKAFLEIKRRNNPWQQYPTVILSLHKVFASLDFNAVTGRHCYFVVQWSDRLAYTDILAKQSEVTMGGRNDRGDWQDFEPVAHMPIEDFKDIP